MIISETWTAGASWAERARESGRGPATSTGVAAPQSQRPARARGTEQPATKQAAQLGRGRGGGVCRSVSQAVGGDGGTGHGRVESRELVNAAARSDGQRDPRWEEKAKQGSKTRSRARTRTSEQEQEWQGRGEMREAIRARAGGGWLARQAGRGRQALSLRWTALERTVVLLARSLARPAAWRIGTWMAPGHGAVVSRSRLG